MSVRRGSNFSSDDDVCHPTPRSGMSQDLTSESGLEYQSSSDEAAEESRYLNTNGVEDSSSKTLLDLGQLNLEETPSHNNPRHESLSEGPYYDSTFQKAFKSAISVVGNMSRNLEKYESSKSVDSDLQRILEKAKTMGNFQNPASQIIGIVGDSAAGKSSLINSLLGIRNLALKGEWGSAVTSFVTEYRWRSCAHTEPFTIEVIYSKDGEINEQIRELLITYRELFRPGLQNELSNTHEEYVHELSNANEYVHIQRRSRIAYETLQSIFPNEPDINAEVLGDWSEGALNRICNRLQVLAAGLDWPEGGLNGKWTSTAQTVKECHKKLAVFMNRGLWPLTDVVRIYLDSQVLKTGVVLADLPGYRDINLARVQKAQQYLIRCDEIFVVANIKRVVTDSSVKAIIREQTGSVLEKCKSIAIVCTHADDIDVRAAEKKYGTVKKSEASRRASAAWKAAAQGDSLHKLQVAEARRKYIYVAARNEDIKKQVAAAYPQLAGKGKNNVFCVGNKDFDGDPYRCNDARTIEVEGSGIPELRRFCHSIIGRAQFRAVNLFMEVEIPALIQSLKVWIVASEQERTPLLPTNCASDLRKSLEAEIRTYHTSLKSELELQILSPLKASERMLDDEAIEISRRWPLKQSHWTQYKAWVRNNGTHATAGIPFHCWNTELLYEMNKIMKTPWDTLESKIETTTTKLQESTQQRLYIMRQQIPDVDALRPLIDSLRSQEHAFLHSLEDESANLLRDVGNTRYNATRPHLSSFALAIMIPTYRLCTQQNGQGMQKRMHAVMESQMQQREIFRHIRQRIRLNAIEAFDKAVSHMTKPMVELCETIKQQIGTVTQKDRQTSGSCPEDLQWLKTLVVQAEDQVRKLQAESDQARRNARGLGYI